MDHRTTARASWFWVASVCLAACGGDVPWRVDAGRDAGDGADRRPADSGAAATCRIETLEFNAPGANGTFGDADDALAGYTVLEYDPAGRTGRGAEYDSPGTDGVWLTPDDTVAWAVAVEGAELRRPLRSTRFNDPGPDRTWDTADDVAVARTIYRYDAADRVTEQDEYSGAGPDATWATADDVLSGRAAYDELDDRGRPQRARIYLASSAGADGVLGTADDEMAALARAEWHDPRYYLAVTVYASPGVDGAWATADDAAVSRAEYTCGVDGATLEMVERHAVDTAGTLGPIARRTAWRRRGECAIDVCALAGPG